MITYKHDGDGKIFYENGKRVVWVCEGLIDNAREVVNILNVSQISLQQLRGDLGALADRLQVANAMRESYYEVEGIVEEMRQLSVIK